MKVMIDTNVLVDLLTERTPYYSDAFDLFTKIAQSASELIGFTTVKSLTDIYYLSRKYYHNSLLAKRNIVDVIDLLYVADDTDIDLLKALESKSGDFEDILLAETSARLMMDYIVTRNVKDFSGSRVKAITPKEFLALLKQTELEAV